MKYIAFLKIPGLPVFWSQEEIKCSHILVLALGYAFVLTYHVYVLDYGLSLYWNTFAELGHKRECLKEEKVSKVFEEENQVSLRT